VPAVSVLLLSYNQSAYLPQAVESVLAQTSHDWELIVLENGSTDGSQQLLQKYADHPQVRLVLHADNQACTKRFNEGVAMARGEFVSLLYSDDWYLPNKVEKQLACFRRAPETGVVYSPGYRYNQTTKQQFLDATVKASGASVLNELFDNLERVAYINPISPMARRECFVRYPFFEDIFIEGEAIYLRHAMRYPFLFDPEPVVVMRDHGANLGRSVKRNVGFLTYALDQIERHPDLAASSRPHLHALKTRLFRNAGWQGIRVADDLPWAREMFRQARALDPRERYHPKAVIGLTLSYLPAYVRRLANRAIFAITRPAGHANYVPSPEEASRV
jgi:glycosyltransferase involved in cell wall biosynthesis